MYFKIKYFKSKHVTKMYFNAFWRENIVPQESMTRKDYWMGEAFQWAETKEREYTNGDCLEE